MGDDEIEVEEQYNLFKEINRLIDSTMKQDERGLVLSMCAFAEDALARLLSAFLMDTKTAGSLIYGANAPLGTFSARMSACHAMGLISDTQFKDLDYVRKIRNEFAHTWQQCSLENPKIKDWLKLMRYSPVFPNHTLTLENKFRQSMVTILVETETLINEITKGTRRLKLQAFKMGSPVMTGTGEERAKISPTEDADQKQP